MKAYWWQIDKYHTCSLHADTLKRKYLVNIREHLHPWWRRSSVTHNTIILTLSLLGNLLVFQWEKVVAWTWKVAPSNTSEWLLHNISWAFPATQALFCFMWSMLPRTLTTDSHLSDFQELFQHLSSNIDVFIFTNSCQYIVSSPIWFRLKNINNYQMDCYRTCHKNPCPPQ